jgi:DNA-directed RNA polymerase specialized sigma24 family protein
MSGDRPLTALFERYAQGALDRVALEGAIFTHIRDNPQRFRLGSWNEEDRLDYLCWLYPRMCRAIDAYRETGANFDAYLASLVRWTSIEYRSTEADRRALERACWEDRAKNAAAEEEPEYLAELQQFAVVKNPRQVLMLALKCCYYVSDDFTARLARAIALDIEVVRGYFDELRQRMAAREERIRILETRAASQYYRCVAFEARLRAAPEGSAHQEEIKFRLERGRKRLDSMRARLARASKDATNREIAEVLGIPKGTVDSCLHAIKAKAAYSRHGPSPL